VGAGFVVAAVVGVVGGLGAGVFNVARLALRFVIVAAWLVMVC
jgi:hypothetical protein